MKASHVEAHVMTELLGSDRYGQVKGYEVGVIPTQLSEVSQYTPNVREIFSNTDIHRMEARMEAQMEVIKQKYDTVVYTMRS